MNIDLSGKTALVTGSIQGIGFAVAKTLALAGAHVVINNHTDADTLEKRAEEIRADGGKCRAVVADLTKRSDVHNLVAAAVEFGGGLNILVNNAGGLIKRVPVADFDEDHFQTVMDVNLKTAFMTVSEATPYLRKDGWGRVVNFASQAGHDGGGPGAAAYAASKGAIWTFTKGIVKELSPYGVTVNAVSPGFIAGTAFHNTFTSPEVHEKVKNSIPLGRLGEAQDVANVVLFLVSDLGAYINGQSIEVNGGLYMP